MKIPIFFAIIMISLNLAAQNNQHTIEGRYEGNIFTIIDSIGDFYIQKREASKNILDGIEYKSTGFSIEVLKNFKFLRSELNIPQEKYIFTNAEGETLVIHKFMDDTRERITTIDVMPSCMELSESKEKRYTCFYVKDSYLVYFYNVKAENNYKMLNSIQSIKNED